MEHEGIIEIKQGKGAFVTAPAFRMSAVERERKLREPVRRLVVEAAQMGAPASQVLRVVQEELAELQGAEDSENTIKLPRKGKA